MPLTARDIPFEPSSSHKIKDRVFRERGDQRYSLELLPIGITLSVDRLRRERDGLMAELEVTVNGHFPQAKTLDGVLSIGDMNLSSVRTRSERARFLSERCGVDGLDWVGFVEELCVRTLAAERHGKPAHPLAELQADDDTDETGAWDVDGFPILKELPMVLFGDSGTGKSYFVLYLAGLLAQMGVNVLYADWEFSHREHRKRFGRLFQPMPKGVIYARCDVSLAHSIDRLGRLLREHECRYLVCDSIGFAVDGPAEAQESARTYFKALRQLGVGSLSVAHIPKLSDDGREAQIFGSVFFKHGARSSWFIDKATANPPGELRFGLHHRKSNVGEHLAPRGYKLVWDRATTRIEPVDLRSIDELSVQLPVLDRIKKLLQGTPGGMAPRAISEELSVPAASIRSTLVRHATQFVKLGNRYAVKADGVEF